MPTMLLALLDEAKNTLKKIDEISGQVQDLRTDCFMLADQIAVLALQDENAPASITQHATPEEFQTFQARFFPYRAVSDQPAPGIQPQTQDDRQATHGSDEAAPGAPIVLHAQSEQVVTEAVSEEPGSPGVEPETAPEPPPEVRPATVSLRDVVLEAYAVSTVSVAQIAAEVKRDASQVYGILREARKAGDKRVVAGDLARAPGALERGKITPNQAREAAALPPIEDRLPPVEEEVERPKRPNDSDGICRINLSEREVTHNDKTIVVTRYEVRVINALNSGAPLGIEGMFQHMSVSTKRRLDTDLGKLNGRLGAIRLMIEWQPGDEYRLVAMD